MNESDKTKFAQSMALLQEVFVRGKPISRQLVEVYFDILKRYDIGKILYSVDQIIKSKKFSTFPLPAEFLEVLDGKKDESIKLRAIQSWQHACSRYDSRDGGKDEKKDPLLDEAIRVAFGGWKQFGQTNPDYEVNDRKHFLQVFESLANKPDYDNDQITLSSLRRMAIGSERQKQITGPQDEEEYGEDDEEEL